MGKLKNNPRYSVVSMRISEAERVKLATLITDKSKNISGVMREALEVYYSSHLSRPEKRKANNHSH